MNLLLYHPSITPDEESDARIRREEVRLQAQWKRDFEEGEEGIVGQLRERIRASQGASRLPPNGVDIQVRGLTYLSPPLPTHADSILTYLSRHLNLFRRVQNRLAPNPQHRRVLLNNLHFDLPGRSMTLLIGSPGSGKSTVCRVLANQDLQGTLQGTILCGGQPVHKRDHCHRVAYVRDCDIHLAHLTVQQTFEYALAMLSPLSAEDRQAKISAIMEILGLSHRADTIVGDDLTRGVSGGERRRVTVGVELLKRAQLFVMDEATTGLDSTTSVQIFKALRIVADEMAPVIATLKQPGRDLYELFDYVMVMHEGQIVYYGPCAHMIDYFEAAGYSVNRSINPADEALSLVDQHGDELVQVYQRLHDEADPHRVEEGQDEHEQALNKSYEGVKRFQSLHPPPSSPSFSSSSSSSLANHPDNNNNNNNNNSSKNTEEQDEFAPYHYPRYNRGWLAQYGWGVKRGAQLFANAPGIVIFRVFFATLMALIIGTLFLRIDHYQKDIMGLRGALFMVGIFPAFQALSGLPTAFATRPVWYYQRKNRYYQAVPILAADLTVALPVMVVESVVFATICYWLIGFNPLFVRYLYFVMMVVSLEILFSFITRIAGFLLPTFQVSNIVMPCVIFAGNFFTGFPIRQDRAPVWLRWTFWLSPFRYLLEGITINELVGADFECLHDELQPPPSDPRFELPYARGGFEGHQICPITTGEEVLDEAGYYDQWAYAWYWFLVLQGATYVAFVLMIAASYYVYRDRLPRDLRHLEQQRAADNLKAQAFKDALKVRSPSLGRRWSASSLSRRPSMDASDSSSSFSEGEGEGSSSHTHLLDVLQATEGGRRLETNVPIVLEWKNVRYTVPIPPKEGLRAKLAALPVCGSRFQNSLRLLNDVSGYVKPGMLVAFMGPSGAGKTTLLDVLAQRKTAGTLEGEIFINGAPLDPHTLPRFSGYVEQQNLHITSETVEEALMLSASLRLSYASSSSSSSSACSSSPDDGESHAPLPPPPPPQISRREKMDHVLWVMDVLSLTPLRDALISELSLEQKKRLTIGVELAANPSLLWLDEPTSGLDAMAALCVMRAVKRIAEQGVSVVCTLHQPSELLFSWASHLLLLAPGGHVVFFGESEGGNEEAKAYFAQFGLETRPQQNDADFFLDCCSTKATNAAGHTPPMAYSQSPERQALQEALEQGIAPRWHVQSAPLWRRLLPCLSARPTLLRASGERPGEEMQALDQERVAPPVYAGKYARSVFRQWLYLTTRNARLWWRSPVPLLAMVCTSLIFGVGLGLLFLDMDHSQLGVGEHLAFFYFLCLVMSVSVMTFIPQIFLERAAFYRETAAHTYAPWVYLVALVTVTLPVIFANSLVVVVPAWAIAPIGKSGWQVGYLWGTLVLTSIVGYGFAMFLSFLSPVPELGNLFFTIIKLLNTLTNGFLLLRTEIPPWWIWAYWAGYQHYALEGMLLNELQGSDFYCPDHEGALQVPVPQPGRPDAVQYYCQYESGRDVLESVKAHLNLQMVDIIVLSGFAALLIGLALLVIQNTRHIKR